MRRLPSRRRQLSAGSAAREAAEDALQAGPQALSSTRVEAALVGGPPGVTGLNRLAGWWPRKGARAGLIHRLRWLCMGGGGQAQQAE
jgi:hypothetical protein